MAPDFRDPQWLRTEQDCLRRARAGDREALGQLYAAFAAPLYRQVILPRVGDPAAAEEVLADAFYAAFSRLAQYTPQGGSMWSWLARIAVNKATDLHRARARQGRALAAFHHLLEPLQAGSPDGPERHAVVQQQQERLHARIQAVLAAVNPRYRRAIELRFLQERSREACAEALEVKLGTFDVVLLRALRAFRKQWDAAGCTPRVDRSAEP